MLRRARRKPQHLVPVRHHPSRTSWRQPRLRYSGEREAAANSLVAVCWYATATEGEPISGAASDPSGSENHERNLVYLSLDSVPC